MTPKTASGACKPTGATELRIFKNIQRAANRIQEHQGKTLLTVDGIIGAKTVAAVENALQMSMSCDAIADRAQDTLSSITNHANSLGAPVVADPTTIRSKLTAKAEIMPDGEVVFNEPGIAGIPFWAIGLVAAVGVGYYATQTKSGKKLVKRLR